MNKQDFADCAAPIAPNAHQSPNGIWCNLSPLCTNCTIYLGDGAVVQAVQGFGARFLRFFARSISPATFADSQEVRKW
jgi:hypothetical protein